MTCRLTRMLATVSATAVLCASPGAQQAPVFRTSVESVVVNVAVTRRGAPVTGLSAADFVVLDNGQRQDIGTVLEATPIDVTFLKMAISTGVDPDQSLVKGTILLAQRVSAFLRPQDRLRLLVGSDQVREDIPMRNLAAPLGPAQLQRASGASLIDAAFHALARPITPGRRHLIAVFTDGMDGRSSTLEADMLPKLAARSDAVLHAILFATPQTSRAPSFFSPRQMRSWTASHDALVEAVERTGGDVHHGERSDARLEKALENFRSSYALHYTPRGVDRGGWHEITVTLPKHPGVEIHARKGYGG